MAGLNITADSHDDVALYAPWGGAVPEGYTTTVDVTDPRFVANGLQVNGVAVPTDWAAQYWGASYQAQFGTDLTPGNGQFGSVRVWYKAPLAQVPPVAVPGVPPTMPLMWMSQPLPVSRDADARRDFALIDCSASMPLARKGSQLFGQGMFARLSVSAVSYLPVDEDASADLVTPLALRREAVERRCADRLTRDVQPEPTDAQTGPGVPVSRATGSVTVGALPR